MTTDRLGQMFDQQTAFMTELVAAGKFPQFPVDITSKSGQQLLKTVSHDCADELHEARSHLRNSKTHRSTQITGIDRDAYIEENADALHYFFEGLIAAGVTVDELFDSYMRKGAVNFQRLRGGY